MVLFLSFIGMIALFISKLILGIGEALALVAHLTCSKRLVISTRTFFTRIAELLLLGLDRQSFKKVLKL